MGRNRVQVLKTLRMHRDTLKQFGVKRLGLFGSCARGTGTSSSDLDFIVDFHKKSFDAYMGLKHFLEDLFDCRVDLVLSDTIKPRLRSRILKETVRAAGF